MREELSVFERLEKSILAELESRKHPGSSVAVVKGSEIVWAKGFGYRDAEKKIKALQDTIYRCASVTKPVVTTGFLQLMEAGKFSLDDPVNEHLDVKVQTKFEEPTIRHLLTHYSGMPTRVPPIYFNEKEALILRDYISQAARTTQPPGKSYAYCNTAFAVIGRLIELFSGKPYDDYIRENVLKPLEMESSDFKLTAKIEESFAQGYERAGGPEEHIEPVKRYILGTAPQDPAGSLFSTVTDLAHFVICHLNGGVYKGRRILRAETVKEMHRPQASSGNSRSGMALSWFRNMHDRHVMLSHTGGVPGFTNHIAFYPELEIGVCWLSNLNDGTAWRPPAPMALRIVAGESPFNPKAMQAVPDEWRKLIGKYGKAGQKYFVKVVNGYLILEGVDGWVHLEKVDESRYLVHGTVYEGYELTFEFDEKGDAKQFDVENQVVPRYCEEPLTVNEEAKLIGSWCGEYVHSYGFFGLDLNIESATQGTATDMEGRKIPLTDFRAENGKVTGTCKFAPPRDYAGWGAGEFEIKLELLAVDDELKGLMTFSSRRAASRLTTPLTLKLA